MVDYLQTTAYAGLASRIKRLSDQLLVSGRNFYKHIGADIEPNWFLVFRILAEDKVTTVSEITQKLNFSHPSVISIIQKMNAAGYIQLKAHKKDNRKQEIRLSKKALDALDKNQRIWSACERAVAAIFENDTFLLELEKVEKSFEKSSFKERALKELILTDLTFIPFENRHAKAFGDLNRAWLQEHFYVEKYDEQLLSDPSQYFIKKGGHIIMGEADGRTIATAGLLKHDSETVELAKMAVEKDFHNLGIGNLLMQAAIDYAKDEKFKTLILYSNRKLKPAIHLYEKFGFKEIPVEEGVAYERCNIKMSMNLNQGKR